MTNGLATWPEIATSDSYRTATPAQQAVIRMNWIRDTAPKLYPEMGKNPALQMAVSRSVAQFELPSKLPDEDSILTPDTLNVDNFVNVERNPLYLKKSYQDQQMLKHVWYARTSVSDQQLGAMPPEKQQAFYTALMRRGPGMSSGILPGYSPEEAQKSFDASGRAVQGTRTFMNNLLTSFGESLTDMFTGPARAMFGQDSVIAHVMDDVEKHREWINDISESNQFFTKTLPSLIGTGAGFAVGPWGKAGEALSGTVKLATGAKDIAKLIEITPGLLEKAGMRAGMKFPSIAYQAAGGAIAGAGQGITDALSKGQPWYTNLAGNVALGLGTEFAFRYIHMFNTIRGAAKQLGMDPRRATELFREPIQAGPNRVLSRELDALIKANPNLPGMMKEMYSADEHGILMKNMYTPQGVKMRANILGMDSEDNGSVLTIKDKQGNPVQTFNQGNLDVRISKATDWLDNQTGPGMQAWLSSQAKKQFSEAMMTAPNLSMRRVTFIPEKARSHIADFLNNHGIMGFDYRLNPTHESIQNIDDVFSILRAQKNPMAAARSLASRGIQFDTESKINVGTIKQLQYELDKILPPGSYLVVDKADPARSRLALPSGNWMPGLGSRAKFNVDINVPHQDIPRVMLEAPDKYEPTMTNDVFVGDPAQLRHHLEMTSRMAKNMDTQLRKQAKSMGVSYRKFADSQVIEIQIPMRDANGNEAMVTLHAPSQKDAMDLLSTGKIDSKEKFAGHFFKDNPQLKQHYDEFLKQMRGQRGQAWVNKNWMPFEFAAAQAKQNDYYLGLYRGKYLLQDLRANEPMWREFNSIAETVDWLNSKESRIGRPEFAPDLSPDALREVYPNIKEPLSDLTPVDIKARRTNLYTAIQRFISPTGYQLERFSRIGAVMDSGMDPVKVANTLSTMSNSVANASTQLTRRIQGIFKGLKKNEGEHLVRWQESLDGAPSVPIVGGPTNQAVFELRKDVEAEMERTYGKQRADELIAMGTQWNRYWNDLFSWSGEDWTKWIKRYFPHLRAEAAKYGGGGFTYQWNKILRNVPSGDRKFFFEFTREMDPSDLGYNAYSKDPVEISKLYTRLMIRKMYVKPVAQMIGKQLREINAGFRAQGKIPKDWAVYENYVSQVLESLNGITGYTERTFSTAWENMSEEFGKRFKNLFGKEHEGTLKEKLGMIQKLRTLSVGGQLAARPYPVIRDLLSAFTSGGPTIGINNWIHGMDAMLRPGAMERLYNLGIAEPGSIPIPGEMDVSGKGLGGVVRTAMAPYKWSVDFFRGTTYFGMEHRATQALARLNAGKIDAKKFLQESGANLFGKPEMNYLIGILNKGQNPALFVHELSKLATGRVHAMYETFNQPSMFRSAVGRLLGQYTTYPINYLNLLITRLGSDSMTFAQKAQFVAEMGAVTGALVYGAQSVGVNPRHWVPWDVAMFQGGPYYQLLDNTIRFLHGDRNALTSVARDMASMVPFALEAGGLSAAYQAIQDGDWWEAFVHLLDAPVMSGDFPKRVEPTDIIIQKIQAAGQAYLKAQGYMK